MQPKLEKPTPVEFAKAIIAKAKLSGDTFVDLSGCGLDEIPESLWELTHLKMLELQGNCLRSIPSKILSLSQLQALELSQNNLVSLPPELFLLSTLQTLLIGSNRLEQLPDTENKLENLIKLDLSDNRLRHLPDSFGNMAKLKFLYCNHNQLRVLPQSFSHLGSLQQFAAADNQIQKFPDSIDRLGALQALDLSNNQLQSIPDELAKLQYLGFLNLAGNASLGLPAELLTIRSQEGVQRKPDELVRAYQNTRGDSGRQLREIKLLVVGRGGAGKTSLVKRLNGEQFDQFENETHGIAIRKLELECADGPMVSRVWDFGGQVILHAMHEFFLTARSLYLLVLTEREDLAQRDAQYWLQLIRVYAPDAPIVIALNKSAHRPNWDLDINQLSRNFGPIVGWTPTDCKTGLGIMELRQLLVGAADHMPEPRKLFPKQWFSIKDAVFSMAQSYMEFRLFRQLCEQHGESSIENQNDLSSWLHDLGIALNYGRDPRLRDTTVLRPDWLANGIYAILRTNDLSKRTGVELAPKAIISIQSLGDIYSAADKIGMLDAADYPEEKWFFIMKLMGLFQLAFPVDPNSTMLLIPSLLTSNEPDSIEDELRTPLRWRYSMKVVPAALIPKFIGNTFALSEDMPRWRRGCMLRFGGATGVIRVNVEENVIDVGISGPASDREDLERMVKGTFEDVFQGYRGIHVDCQTRVEENWIGDALLRKLSKANALPQ